MGSLIGSQIMQKWNKMDKDTFFYCFVSWGCGIIMGILILSLTGNIEAHNKEEKIIPYEQSYEYLFDRVDSYPSHIIRTDYYGREYITVPLLVKNCSVEDYILIKQDCYPRFVNVATDEGEEK